MLIFVNHPTRHELPKGGFANRYFDKTPLFATVAIGVAGYESTGVVFEFMCRSAGAARLGCVPHTLAADVSKVTDGVEENIGGVLTFYRLLRQHHKHLKSINLSNG